MEKVFEHSLGKDKAIKLCKKAISGKMAILSTENPFKVGTPPLMTALIEVTDTTITIKSKSMGDMIGQTAANEIAMALDDLQEQNVNQNVSVPTQPQNNLTNNSKTLTHEQYLKYQHEAIALLKEYKTLVDGEIITQEDFDKKKEDILNFINGVM